MYGHRNGSDESHLAPLVSTLICGGRYLPQFLVRLSILHQPTSILHDVEVYTEAWPERGDNDRDTRVFQPRVVRTL